MRPSSHEFTDTKINLLDSVCQNYASGCFIKRWVVILSHCIEEYTVYPIYQRGMIEGTSEHPTAMCEHVKQNSVAKSEDKCVSSLNSQKMKRKERKHKTQTSRLTLAPSGPVWRTSRAGSRRRAEHGTAPSVCSWELGKRPWSPTHPSPVQEPGLPTGQSPGSPHCTQYS